MANGAIIPSLAMGKLAPFAILQTPADELESVRFIKI